MIRPASQHLSSFVDVRHRRSVSSQVIGESGCCSALTSPDECWRGCGQAHTRNQPVKVGSKATGLQSFQHSFGDQKGLPSSDLSFEWKQSLDADPEAYGRDLWISFSPAHEIECSGRKRT